ncbi:MAG: hypothetical protein DIU78_020435 [Pseudomonadota bacterium]
MDAHRFHALGPALSLLLFAAAARSEPHRDARPQADASTKADASTANASKAETTKAEPSKADASKAEAARAETPKGDASKTGAAKAEAPKVEPSKPDAPKAEAGKGDASRADASKAEASEGGKQAMCAFEGRAEPRASTPIVDANGRVLARFSGAPTPLAVTQLPTHAGGLARVSTGTGTGSFRVHGFVSVRELPLYSKAPIAVTAGHLWIAPGSRVEFVSARPGAVRVQKQPSAPFAQAVSAWAPCAALALAPAAHPASSPEDGALPYALRRPRLAIRARPGNSARSVVTLVRASDGAGTLFFVRERRGEWLHVEHRGELIVDGWVERTDLEALPIGEHLTEQAPAGSWPARLAVRGEPRVIKVPREVPFRQHASSQEPPIGVIEPEAEAYVLDRVADWVSVMPKALQVVPGGDGQFWVKASDLGL